MLADLHIHTTASDGSIPPEELPDLAKAAGLECIAITDHDTVAGVEPARKAAQPLGMKVIAGIEVSTDYLERDVHLLGYGIDISSPVLEEVTRWSVKEKMVRNHKIVEKLQGLGYDITWEDIHLPQEGTVAGRPHIAQALVDKGYASSVGEVFQTLVGEGKPAYVPRQRISLGRAIDVIRQAGGQPVLAHPLQYGFESDELDAFVAFAARHGAAGLEVVYTGYSRQEQDELKKLAVKYGLFITGGSDFHGSCKPDIVLGSIKFEFKRLFGNAKKDLR